MTAVKPDYIQKLLLHAKFVNRNTVVVISRAMGVNGAVHLAT